MNKELKKLLICALFTALAILVEYLSEFLDPIQKMVAPDGGNPFGVAMVFIVIAGTLGGFWYGTWSGLIFGMVNWMLGGIPLTINWGVIFLDYLLPFASIGLVAGLLRKFSLKNMACIALTVFLACLLRFTFHTISSIVCWEAPLGASLLYNLAYMLPATALTIIVVISLYNVIKKTNTKFLA